MSNRKMSTRKENQKKSDGKQIPLTEDGLKPWEIEVPEFIPTRYDLLQLVEYWEKKYLSHQWNDFKTGWFEPDWEANLNSGRTARIAELLGEEEVKRVIDQVWEKFSRGCDARTWDIFLHGDEEQWKAVQEPYHQELQERHERLLKEKEDLGA